MYKSIRNDYFKASKLHQNNRLAKSNYLNKKLHIIGLMSGTSLDGLDVCYCSFDPSEINFSIHATSTYSFSDSWKSKLQNAHRSTAYDLAQLDADLAKLFAEKVKLFIKENDIKKVDAISSHGHTVFHQPINHFTKQIANGAYLAALSGFPVVSDFRSADVALGGQGAPLVPIGDRDLFKQHRNRLNLGGIANISYENEDHDTIAFDVCPANMALNELARAKGVAYDKHGKIAASGTVDHDLLTQLNSLKYYHEAAPKSMGIEWYMEHFSPVVNDSPISIENKMRTVVEHISQQLASHFKDGSVLLSGGGAHNYFLVERIKANTENTIILPDKDIIDFKEALIFAYLGFLRLRNEINVLSSVTGASKDHCAGNIHY